MEGAIKNASARIHTDQILQHLVSMTETAIEMSGKISQEEKYINYLRSVTAKESRTVTSLKIAVKAMLGDVMKVAQSTLIYLGSLPNEPKNNELKSLFERLHSIMEKEKSQHENENIDTFFEEESDVDLSGIVNKIKYMETRQRSNESLSWASSHGTIKIGKSDFDEKYPETCSKESLVDFESGSSLAPVPEGAFTDFKRSPRSCSLSSIKTMKKMRLSLRQYSEYEQNELREDNQEYNLDVPELEHLNEIHICEESQAITPSNVSTTSEDSGK